MKKNIILAAIAAASALLLSASCAQLEQDTEIQSLATEGKIFTAKIDQEISKTTLTDQFKVHWEAGDLIDINGTEYCASPLPEDATLAKFTKVNADDNDAESPYKAIFPSDISTVDGYVFPDIQLFEAGKFNAPMYAEGDGELLSFKNICGVLRFALKGTDKVKSISVTANEPVCGAFEMEDQTTINLSGDTKTITLECAADGIQLNSETTTIFYIYLPPKDYSAGMKISITNTDGLVFRKVTEKEASISRGNSYTFNWDVDFTLALTGEFSVSADKKVNFSQGNLYVSNGIWGFFDNQYDWLTKLDLFTWGYGDWSADLSYGYVTGHPEDGDVLAAEEDWASRIGNGTLWRTLTADEWHYLTSEREGAADKCRNGITVCGQQNCFIIAPDNFAGSIEDSYDAAAWAAAEESGLVCLPPTGYYNGYGRYDARHGYYWTATSAGPLTAHYFSFDPKEEPQPVMKANRPKMAKSVAGNKQDATAAANSKSANTTGLEFTKPADFVSSRFADLKNVTPSSDLKFGNQDIRKSDISFNAKQQGVQKETKIFVNKKLKANHKSAPKAAPAKALQAAGGPLVISKTEVDDSYVASDGEWDIYLYTNIGGVDVIVGLYGYNETLEGTYDWATNMNEYSSVFDTASMGWNFYEEFTACNFTVTSLGDNKYSCAGSFSIASGDFTFSTTLSYTPHVPQTYTLTASNFSDDYYYGRMVNFTTEIGYFSFLVNAEELESGKTYGWDDMDHTSTLSCYSEDGYYVTSGYTDADLTKTVAEDGSFTVVAHATLTNGDQVTINYEYEKPDAKEININVDNATLTNRLTAGYWTIDGQTADKNNSFMLYFISKGLQGTWTDVKKFDSYSTWVSDKSTGKNVYYENLSAVNLTSKVVENSLVIEGTLSLADSNGNPANVTVHISTPFTQTWGEWADFAPFDFNTGKFNYATLGAYTQTGIKVQERKDNTGLKQYKLKNWGKGYYDGVGQDLILNMNPDYTFTFVSDVVNVGANVVLADVATAYNNPAYASFNSYNPETGVFNFYTAVVFASSGQIYTNAEESFVMDKPITERDTVKVTADMKVAPEPAKGIIKVSAELDKTTYILEVVGDNPIGTFSFADGTLSKDYYYGIVSAASRSDFAEGEVTIAENGTGLKLNGLMIGEDEKAYVLDWTYTPITQRDTVKVNLESIIVEEDFNSQTGAHRGWLFEGQDTDTLYIVQVLGNNQLGTFSYADGTLGMNFYNIIPSSGQGRCQFTEGEVTIVEDEEGLKLTGLLIGEDEKAYVFNWIQPAGILQYDTDAPFNAEFGTFPDSSFNIEDGVISIYANDGEKAIGLTLYTDPSATEIPEGTYIISDTEEIGTALKSVGLDEDYNLNPCWAGTIDGNYIGDCFFMVEGTVTVAKDKYGDPTITVDAKNSYGQEVKATIWPGSHRSTGMSVRLVADVKDK